MEEAPRSHPIGSVGEQRESRAGQRDSILSARTDRSPARGIPISCTDRICSLGLLLFSGLDRSDLNGDGNVENWDSVPIGSATAPDYIEPGRKSEKTIGPATTKLNRNSTSHPEPPALVNLRTSKGRTIHNESDLKTEEQFADQSTKNTRSEKGVVLNAGGSSRACGVKSTISPHSVFKPCQPATPHPPSRLA
jgi:hypothetical protein